MNSGERASPDRFPTLVATVSLIALALCVAESARNVVFQVPTVDSATYAQQALAIAAGKPAPPEAFWQPPLYPYALALLYRAGLHAMTALRFIHGLTALAAAILTVTLARRIMRPRLATVAGVVVALYGPLLFYATQLLPTGLGVTLGLLALLATVRLAERPSPWRAASCGAAFGLAALALPNLLACALVPAAGLARQWRRATDPLARLTLARQLGALLAGIALLVAPVTLRNLIVSGDWVPISTNGGINLYLANNADTDQTLTARPGQDWERLVSLPYRNGARSASDAQSYFTRETLRFAATSPVALFRGFCAKAWLLLAGREIPRNHDIYTFREQTWLLALLVWRLPGFAFPFGLVGPLGLFGAFMAARAGRTQRLVVAHVAIYALTLVLFYPADRYRLPLVPPLAILAVLGADTLVTRWRTGARSAVAATALGLLLIGGWPRRVPTDTLSFAAELHQNVGVGLQVRGRLDDALKQYDAALAHDPASADALYYRGTALRELGRRDEAREAFQAALAARPNHIKALNDLGVMQYEAGRTELAAELLRRALNVDPRNARAMQNLALAEVRLGHPDEAQRLMQRARLARESTPAITPP
ncbi:MAG: tetratricopeptide repeat protein [Lentisphaerae bacterium]|nr:tetratricopeptide repeat protein [Lentisphaerota bacterium]